MLDVVVRTLGSGVVTVGALMAIWGGVQIGLALGGSHGQASGADLGPGILAVVGGAVIGVCGLAIFNVDMSWAS